jgi:hypothetical protein
MAPDLHEGRCAAQHPTVAGTNMEPLQRLLPRHAGRRRGRGISDVDEANAVGLIKATIIPDLGPAERT